MQEPQINTDTRLAKSPWTKQTLNKNKPLKLHIFYLRYQMHKQKNLMCRRIIQNKSNIFVLDGDNLITSQICSRNSDLLCMKMFYLPRKTNPAGRSCMGLRWMYDTSYERWRFVSLTPKYIVTNTRVTSSNLILSYSDVVSLCHILFKIKKSTRYKNQIKTNQYVKRLRLAPLTYLHAGRNETEIKHAVWKESNGSRFQEVRRGL